MSRVVEKIKIAAHQIYFLLGGAPERYWSWLVGFFLLALLVMVGINVLVYQNATNTHESLEVPLSMSRGKVNEKALEHILSTLSSRQDEFEKILQEPRVPDPSL